MRALLAPLEELGEYEEIKKMLVSKQACVALSGCVDSQKLHMVYGIGDGFRNKIIVTFSDLRAKELYEDYKFYDRNVMLYPAKGYEQKKLGSSGKRESAILRMA